MGFTAHKSRQVYPRDLYAPPDEPHHVHLPACPDHCRERHDHVPTCLDHRVDSCPEEHWLGGHPEPSHPHYVEFDGATGAWGYTRLSDEEIADQALLEEFERELRVKGANARAARRAVLTTKAKDDPAFRVLLEELGLS